VRPAITAAGWVVLLVPACGGDASRPDGGTLPPVNHDAEGRDAESDAAADVAGRVCPIDHPGSAPCDAPADVWCCYDAGFPPDYCACVDGTWDCAPDDCWSLQCDPEANAPECPIVGPEPSAPCSLSAAVSCCYDEGTTECACPDGLWECVVTDCSWECPGPNP
jgi:hypothetical protein